MAVVSALLVVAAVTIIVVQLLHQQSAQLRTAQSDQTRIHARWVLQSGLAWAQRVLVEDASANAVTRLDAAWAQPLVDWRFGLPEQAGGAMLYSGRLEDEQSKFNLRSFARPNGVDLAAVDAFKRLCAQLGVPAQTADRIVWRMLIALPRLSQNEPSASEENQGEAESAGETAAGNQAQPSRAAALALPAVARAPMIRSIDDLIEVPGVERSAIERLRPFVTVLPSPVLVNANTATPEVLAAVIEGLSLQSARELVRSRDQGQWFVSRGDLVNRLRQNQKDLQIRTAQVAVRSSYFSLHAVARSGPQRILYQALLERPRTGQPTVVWSREGV
ncbi:type II secretion system minor pseudopilin GspK [Bordetella ansorpii]|nr:type II secretion system minor pseudopilin GspK [Bordetella ansorpii]